MVWLHVGSSPRAQGAAGKGGPYSLAPAGRHCPGQWAATGRRGGGLGRPVPLSEGRHCCLRVDNSRKLHLVESAPFLFLGPSLTKGTYEDV